MYITAGLVVYLVIITLLSLILRAIGRRVRNNIPTIRTWVYMSEDRKRAYAVTPSLIALAIVFVRIYVSEMDIGVTWGLIVVTALVPLLIFLSMENGVTNTNI